MRIVIVTIKSWNIKNFEKLKNIFPEHEFNLISTREELNLSSIRNINPDYIFFPHWSWMIPKDIFDNYKCIVFHMTDLPYGRGGSPLQNLISRGQENTKISAIDVVDDIDAGAVYYKTDLNLNGSAEEIYIRASDIIFYKMIPYIINNKPTPYEQKGDIISFKRRKPMQSEIEKNSLNLKVIFDQIRMLDAEGYPAAFILYGKFKFSFSRAKYTGNKIIADVEIQEVFNE